ncbi:hypothetical protein Clacol_004841 [Clathrus columnatus]|uniref:Oxysterol-binding protein n=1 Tax=Clathrus columnatus TaxID=1419009 RepID=A0AAV5AD31_9AGAM|nr:hypothetical protein Clacol_004841 [Clathrus columnatus]
MSAAPPSPIDDDSASQIYDDETPEAMETQAEVVPDSGEGGKLKMIMSLLKKCLGVKDIAAMRISLPASLLEPLPNLEYWTYLDRPDLFAAINDVEDPFLRMLAVIRFTFSKDLKFIRGKICKPYNSVLGEHFRAHWDVIPAVYSQDSDEPPTQHLFVSFPADPSQPDIGNKPSSLTPNITTTKNGNRNSDTLSVRSSSSGKEKNRLSTSASASPISQALLGESNLEAGISNLSLGESDLDAKTGQLLEADVAGGDRLRIVYLTEQVCHHPPISSWYATCPAKNMTASGVDQISAKVSGTSIRVGPGARNKGIFIKINGGPGAGERYKITHPAAYVNGILRGSPYATVSDSSIITVAGGKSNVTYRAIIEYKEESWLGKPQFAVEGVIHICKPEDTGYESWTRVKHVPRDRVVAQFEGSWKHLIRWKRTNETEWKTLIDLSTLHVIPKSVRPLSIQQPNESRKLWEYVTSNLLKKEYSEATKVKLAIEQRQRDLALERKKKGIEFQPVYFEKNIDSGESFLTAEGQKAIDNELAQVEADDH